MERDWAGELEAWLNAKFAELCDTIGYPAPLSGLRISPALGVEESRYFLLGLEDGLFQPDELGYVQSELLPTADNAQARQKMCRLFWHAPPPPRISRECVCQLSTASSLILKRGWLASHLLLEPDLRDEHDISYGIDLLIRLHPGQILVAVEVKRSAVELQKLITDLRMCCKRGPHAKDDCGFPQNHPKYEFCAHHRPEYFWAVAPETDICLRMHYSDLAIELEELPSLPPRSLLE
ncbi:MAG: hypothetical protein DMF06_01430 [Verrucomicrobia bacterium]|nr:MAG: hypothetical protein DMF06_01430 [Verrucomicrobiota bacterium]